MKAIFEPQGRGEWLIKIKAENEVEAKLISSLQHPIALDRYASTKMGRISEHEPDVAMFIKMKEEAE